MTTARTTRASPRASPRAAPPAHAVRNARTDDLAQLQAWLPPGAARDLPDVPTGTDAWLVATDADDRPLACLRLRHAIGLDLPRHWYHVGCVVHAAPELGLFHRLQTLQLGNDLTGARELADIAWRPGLGAAGQAAVLAPLLRAAIAAVRATPAPAGALPLLIAELPGLQNADGRWPFWQGLARPFHGGDPRAAAARFGPAWRSHVAVLMPRQAVYSAFLPPEAQAAIGRPHAATVVLQRLLRRAGLRPSGHVTIDQGGPVLAAPLDALRSP